MAKRREINATLRHTTKLPPITGNCLPSENTFQKCGGGKFPSYYLRLPRINGHSPVQSESPLTFREREEKEQFFLIIDEKPLRPLRQHVKKPTVKKNYKMDPMIGLNKQDDASMHSWYASKDNTSFKDFKTARFLQRQVHSLQRSLKPGRLYQNCNGKMPYEELLLLNENAYQATSPTERGKKWMDIKDFNEKINWLNCHEAKDRDLTPFNVFLENHKVKIKNAVKKISPR